MVPVPVVTRGSVQSAVDDVVKSGGRKRQNNQYGNIKKKNEQSLAQGEHSVEIQQCLGNECLFAKIVYFVAIPHEDLLASIIDSDYNVNASAQRTGCRVGVFVGSTGGGSVGVGGGGGGGGGGGDGGGGGEGEASEVASVGGEVVITPSVVKLDAQMMVGRRQTGGIATSRSSRTDLSRPRWWRRRRVTKRSVIIENRQLVVECAAGARGRRPNAVETAIPSRNRPECDRKDIQRGKTGLGENRSDTRRGVRNSQTDFMWTQQRRPNARCMTMKKQKNKTRQSACQEHPRMDAEQHDDESKTNRGRKLEQKWRRFNGYKQKMSQVYARELRKFHNAVAQI
ncbi:hypothetical protein C8J57DRAFT_1220176 [Mycena rebaudengoi]|nr:hypothetical protein C8J57DRAFT_1220176 [Mycena rebaudengoi]